jgi:type IV pilus biogenesis protein CpaD/CtpE
MKTQLTTMTALLALTATLGGCAHTTPSWDNNFGASVRASTAAQVADPAAAANTNPVTGIDGGAARNIQRHYEGSYVKPEPHGSAMTTGSGK